VQKEVHFSEKVSTFRSASIVGSRKTKRDGTFSSHKSQQNRHETAFEIAKTYSAHSEELLKVLAPSSQELRIRTYDLRMTCEAASLTIEKQLL